TRTPVLLVPPGKTFLIGETQLSGPCNSSVDFQTLAFAHCNDLYVKGITIKNSADKHMTFFACVGVNINWIKITAPGDSPNTDGMYFSSCQNVTVSGSRIGTGESVSAVLQGRLVLQHATSRSS
ncbi:hypothetical protein GW17_00005180, partial [Ensete ventricosum]